MADEAQGVTFVELFFDLVFVFAITSVTRLLLHDLDWAGAGRSALILWLVWWAWSQFTWTLNPADTGHSGVRLLTLAATAAAFFMAQAIPDAYDSAGAWFAFAYVTVRLLGLGLQLAMWGAERENASAVATWVASSSVGLVLVAAGGLVDSPYREILWGAALAFDLLAALRAGEGRWDLHAEHFAERHGLIVIIALGESLIAGGVALSGLDRDLEFAVGTATAVALVCVLWWIYFAVAKDRFEAHLAAQPPERTGHEARDVYSWGHLPVIAGVIAFAVAIEQVLKHTDERIGGPALVALGAGVVLYLGGIAFGLSRSGHRPLTPWAAAVVGTVVVAALAALAPSGLVPLAAATLSLAAFATWAYRAEPA